MFIWVSKNRKKGYRYYFKRNKNAVLFFYINMNEYF